MSHVVAAGLGHTETPAARAVVLAADRGAADPVARFAGAPCKALAPVAGRAMVLRVLDTLAATSGVGEIALCGPPAEIVAGDAALSERVERGDVRWLASREGPSASAAAAFEALGGDDPLLLTTADHPLLTTAMVRAFLGAAASQPWDAAVGVVRYECVQQGFAGVRRTVTRLRDGDYCGTNLFAFTTPEGRRLAAYWAGVEARRKRPWRTVLATVGPGAVVRYAFGRLTLESVLAHLSRRLGLQVGAVVLPYAASGVDVDTPEDLRLVEAALDPPGAVTG